MNISWNPSSTQWPVQRAGQGGAGASPTQAPWEEALQVDGVNGQDAAQKGQCQTCKDRKYQDGSGDPGVSYKTPTNIDPKAAVGAVRSHEMEHVYRERFKAESEGRRILFQNVTLHSGICPECGKVYVSGGTTRTVTKAEADPARYSVGLPGAGDQSGKEMSIVA